MYKIPVFKAEKDIAAQIQAAASIAWVSRLEKGGADQEFKLSNKDLIEKFGEKVKASEHDSDLYPTKSVLVTTSWNKNDDVFNPVEVWAARHTPIHKPDNIGHVEDIIVGHTTNCVAVDAEYNILPDDATIEDLPDLYHLVTSAVIYKAWQKEEYKERTEKLIAEIEAGDKFVSMECLFRGFDYALIYPDKSTKILARKEDTAFLTKHLRAYGGEGVYDGVKVGRLLKGITFSGKGYVDKPANPDSIIFNSADILSFGKASVVEKNEVFNEVGVLRSSAKTMENNKMPELDVLQKENTELKAQLAVANDKLAKTNEEQYTKQIADLNSKISTSTKSYDDLKGNFDKITSELEAANKAKSELETAKTELAKELDIVKAKELLTSRISMLVSGGVDADEAKAKAEKFASLNDEMFKDVAEALVAGVKKKDEKKEEKKEEKEAKADDKVNQALEEAKPEEKAELAAAGEKDNANLREEISKVIASRFSVGKKKAK